MHAFRCECENQRLVAVEVCGDKNNSFILGVAMRKLEENRCGECESKGGDSRCSRTKKEVVRHDPYMGDIWCSDQTLQMNRVSLIPVEGMGASTLQYRTTSMLWWEGRHESTECAVHEEDIRLVLKEGDYTRTLIQQRRQRVSSQGEAITKKEFKYSISSEVQKKILSRMIFEENTGSRRD